MARGRTKNDTDTAVDTQPEFASVDDRPDDREPARRVRPVKRARVGVVVLTVLLVELILIAAGANQGVSKHFASYANDHPSSLPGHLARSLLILRWQVSPSGHTDLWHTELITVGLVLLLGIVLVPMVVHGPVNWLRAFLGTWFTITVSVVVATVAALVLADLEESRDLALYVVPGTPSTGLSIGNKIGDATFGPVLSYAFVAGLGLGLVTALIVSILVASTRRTDPVPVAVAAEPGQEFPPESPQPFFGNAVDDDRTARTSGYGTSRYADSSPYADSHAYASPDRRAAENETTALPAVGAGAGAGAASSYAAGRYGDDDSTRTTRLDRTPGESSSESTTTLPRVDDEPAPAAATAKTQEPAPSEPAESETTQAWPAQPAPEADAPADTPVEGERTAAFPRPPDDEDLDHQPYHNED